MLFRVQSPDIACFRIVLQCDALLPAIATLLRASPPEFRELKMAVSAARSKAVPWWPSA